MPETLIDLLRRASSVTERGYTFLDEDLKATEWSFRQLNDEAERRGRYLLSLGLKKGDRLAMVIPDGEQFVLSFLGALRAGIVPVPMYPPLALGKLDAYIETARRIMTTAGATMLLTSKKVAPLVWSLVGKVKSLEDLHVVEKIRDHDPSTITTVLDESPVGPEDIGFLQFTSGSTSDPKGVIVTHANLVANAQAIMIAGLRSDPTSDRALSWLPLYHDMGLIGFVIAPLFNTVPIVFVPTISFVKKPNVWMETITKYRATITFAPNFAFGLAAKRASSQRLKGFELSCLRVVGCGAEPINAATMRTFVETFAPVGFNPNALMPSYGMAEATLAISFDDLDSPFESLIIDRDAYEEEHVAIPVDEARGHSHIELVSCGKTFPGHEVRIMDVEGNFLPEGRVGEIVLSGPSVAAGYYQNEHATRSTIVDGWLHTGDLGFLFDGNLYISGRMKDLIILNGRNYYPQSIEWEVERVEGIRRGNVVAFSTPGTDSEQLVVVAETKSDDASLNEKLDTVVKQRVHDALGVRARTVALIGAGALPKTSSGKVQRAKTKRMFENGSLGKEGNRSLGSNAARLALAKHVAASAFSRIGHEVKRPARNLARALRGEEPSES